MGKDLEQAISQWARDNSVKKVPLEAKLREALKRDDIRYEVWYSCVRIFVGERMWSVATPVVFKEWREALSGLEEEVADAMRGAK